MDLRNQKPEDTFQYIVTTDGSQLFTGTGSLLSNLNITHITSSQVTESIILTNQVTASSILTTTLSSSVVFTTNITASSISASLVGNTNAFIQGGNSFGQSGSLGTNDQNILVLRAAGIESVYISASMNGSTKTVGVSINATPVDGFPLAVGGTGQIQLTGSSPRIVVGDNSSSLKIGASGPGLFSGSRMELSGEGNADNFVDAFNLAGGVYFSTKVSGSYVFQNSPNIGSINNASTLMAITSNKKVCIGTGSAATASLDVNGDIRASTNITASNISASTVTSSLQGTSSWSTNARTSSNGSVAWGYLSYNGTTLVSNTYNVTVTRGAVGSYNVLFQNSLPSGQYAVIANAHSGSDDTSATGSIVWARSQTTTGFTMSCQIVTALTVLSDFTTASFSVFNY